MKSEEERTRQQASDWIVRLENDADGSLRASFEAWLDRDPLHREVFARMSRRLDDFARLPPDHVASGRRLDRHGAVRRGRLALAAALVLGSALALALLLMGQSRPTGEARRYAGAAHAVRPITLPDGTRVTLDAGAELAQRPADASRRIALVRGRARFAPSASARDPLLVLAGDCVVTATRSLFDVEQGSGMTRIALYSGSLRIDHPGSGAITLRAGERAVFLRGALQRPPQPIGPAVPRWPSGLLEFTDTRLADAVAELNRYNRSPIVLVPPVGGERISGAFRADDPAGFARAAAAMFGLEWRRTGDGSIELRAARET